MQVYSSSTLFRRLAPTLPLCLLLSSPLACSQSEKFTQNCAPISTVSRIDSNSCNNLTPSREIDQFKLDEAKHFDLAQNHQIKLDQFELDLSTELNSLTLSVHAQLYSLADREQICLPAFGQRMGEKLDLVPTIAYDAQTFEKIVLDEEGCFLVHAAQSISINYKLTSLGPLKNRLWVAQTLSSVVKPEFIAFPSESIFLERVDADRRQVRVAVHKNSTYNQNVYTTLKLYDSSYNNLYYIAADYFDLNRSYFVFGELNVISNSASKPVINLYLDNKFTMYGAVILKECRAIFDYYSKNLPKHVPEFINIFVFSGEHDALQLDGFARPNGVIFQFGQEAIRQTLERRMLIAHELFHLYNGENLHYDQNDYHKISWFLEGATHFIALHTLVTLNYASLIQINDILSGFVNQIAAASPKREYQPYVDGFFLTWLIQLIWSKDPSLYSSSILQFWTYLDDIADWSKKYNLYWIKHNLENYSGYAFDDFFQHYIVDNNSVPYRSILNDYGLCIRRYDLQKYDLGMSYRFDSSLACYVVTYVEPNSVAASAGLRVGDRFIPQKSFNWRIPEDKYIYKFVGDDSFVSMKLPVAPVIVTQYEVVECK